MTGTVAIPALRVRVGYSTPYGEMGILTGTALAVEPPEYRSAPWGRFLVLIDPGALARRAAYRGVMWFDAAEVMPLSDEPA